jgi:hypothetical protein
LASVYVTVACIAAKAANVASTTTAAASHLSAFLDDTTCTATTATVYLPRQIIQRDSFACIKRQATR